jgi:CBS-domain-containing membrane protein
VLVLDAQGAPARWVPVAELDRVQDLAGAGSAVRRTLRPGASLADVLDELLRSQDPGVAVVDGDGRLVGVVDLASVSRAAATMHPPPPDGHAADPAAGGRRAGAAS